MDFAVRTLRTLLMNTEGRKPTARQIAAVENYVADSRKSKAEAIREAGYGESTARHPDRVFGSPIIQKVLHSMGLHDESEAVAAVQRGLTAKYLVNFTFPPLLEPNEVSKEGENTGKYFGERLTDQEICEYLQEGGITISKVVHGNRERRFYGYTDNAKVQLSAADKLLKVFGAYAPTKVIGKHAPAVGIMSMHELREKIKQEEMKVI